MKLVVMTTIAAAVLAGCGGDEDPPDPTGSWTITTHTLGSDCQIGEQPVGGFDRVNVLRTDDATGTFFNVQSCTSSNGMCQVIDERSIRYDQPLDGGYRGVRYDVNGNTDSCNIVAVPSTVKVNADGTLTVDTESRTATIADLPACTAAEAALHFDDLVCGNTEHVVATRL